MARSTRNTSQHTNHAALEPGLEPLRRGRRRMLLGVAVVAVALPVPVLGGVFGGQEGFVMGCGLQLLLLVLCAVHTGYYRPRGMGGRW